MCIRDRVNNEEDERTRKRQDLASAEEMFLGLIQEAFGVNAHIRHVVERFAAQGYVAIAPELFHRTAPAGFTCAYNDFPSVMPHMTAVNGAVSYTHLRPPT